MTKDSCADCKFFKLSKGDLGNCLYNTPTVTYLVMPKLDLASGQAIPHIQDVSGWPVTRPGQWCGKWEAEKKLLTH